MRFTDAFLDEIRARLPASEVIGRQVKLRKQGREFAGLSPFNAEKTPSFFVNDQKQKWFDFSSNKNGDIFTFLMETEGLTFPEAVERLAGEAGLDLPARDPRAEERARERASLFDVTELAARYFEDALQSSGGAAARGYLQGREIPPTIQRAFRIGYAPAVRNGLKQHLADKGIDQEQMIAAGLLIHGDDIAVSYDRFRDRIMFPITDLQGRIVGFGGRAMSADVKAKYLNSPDSGLFHKGTLVYNGQNARRAAHDAGTVVVVEGYADVVQMARAGFDHTVAPLGTALTERQLQILWRMADEPILCFDGDKAGRKAAYRAAEVALPMIAPGKSLGFAMLPTGQDPDDLIRASGAEAMQAVLDGAQPLIDILWARETGEGRLDTPERRAALESRLRDLARTISDASVRRHYAEQLKSRLQDLFGYGEAAIEPSSPTDQSTGGQRRRGARRDEALSPTHRPPISPRLKAAAGAAGAGEHPLREAVLAMTMINHPELISDHIDEFCEVEFTDRAIGDLRRVVLDIISRTDGADAGTLRAALEAGPQADLVRRLERQVEAIGHWPARVETDLADAAEGWRQALVLHHRSRTLHRELREAEAALASDPSDLNLARLVDIQNQLANTEGTEALIEGFGAGSGRATPAF